MFLISDYESEIAWWESEGRSQVVDGLRCPGSRIDDAAKFKAVTDAAIQAWKAAPENGVCQQAMLNSLRRVRKGCAAQRGR